MNSELLSVGCIRAVGFLQGFPYQPPRDTTLSSNHHVEKGHTEDFGAFHGPKTLLFTGMGV